MHLPRPVDRDPHQKLLLRKEPRPFVREQRPVRLYRIFDPFLPPVHFLELHRLSVELPSRQQRFPTVPTERHHRHLIRLDILFDEPFEQLVAHHLRRMCLRRQPRLVQVVTVRTIQVTRRPDRFDHSPDRPGPFSFDRIRESERRFFSHIFAKIGVSSLPRAACPSSREEGWAGLRMRLDPAKASRRDAL